MKDLIKKSIQHLLDNIQSGVHDNLDHTDLAEQVQIDEEDVYEFAYKHYSDDMPEDVDSFADAITDVLNSSWYDRLYQEHIDRAREGIRDQQDWNETKQSLQPSWLPNK